MISIIIPAHNEEAVIKSCLIELFPGIEANEFEVIVVCNGCSDRTADVVRSISPMIDCVEVEKPSKTNALNVGDSHAHYYPRIYLDSDVRISYSDMKKMVEFLGHSQLLAVSPCMNMEMGHSSWAVRAFYEVWSRLPYCKAGLIGVGVYALSEEGRSRFHVFPDIIADDGYIRLLFGSDERGAVPGVYSTVVAPANLVSLIKIKTRSRLGGYELKEKYPALFTNDDKDYSAAFSDMFSSWRSWPQVVVYVLVNIVTRVRAKFVASRSGYSVWERDESSRM